MDLDAIKARASEAVRPLKPPSDWSSVDWISCKVHIGAGDELAEAHFVLALLVGLLDYKYAGRTEGCLWSIPVELNDTSLFIEHRKFGLGIFAPCIPSVEGAAREVVNCIDRGIQSVRESGYFEAWTRGCAKDGNVILANDSILLYERYLFSREAFERQWAEVEQNKSKNGIGNSRNIVRLIEQEFSCSNLRKRAAWFGQFAIESFFSWIEHIFVHLAILLYKEEVSSLAKCEKFIGKSWIMKYESVFDTKRDKEAKAFLIELRKVRESRNFVSHGHFGKHGETLWVPTRLGCFPYNVQSGRPRDLWGHHESDGFAEHESLLTVDRFIDFLWSGVRQPARVLLQETAFPTSLNLMRSGRYREAMKSEPDMKSLVYELDMNFSIHANMEF